MIDTHCHLADTKFDADRDEVIARAEALGITNMICIADTITESKKCLEIAQKYDQIFCTIGVHPHCAKEWKTGDSVWIQDTTKSNPKVVAIGEIGLDYHYMMSPKETQISVFREQLMIAKSLGKPAVVHCREAIEDVRAIIDELKPPKVVLHCCTEKWEDVEPLVKSGHLLSFTGIATFPASTEIRRTIEMCPIENMMVETDSPYLAPIPHRGKRCEPAFVIETAKTVAKIKGISFDAIDEKTTQAARLFFGLPRV